MHDAMDVIGHDDGGIERDLAAYLSDLRPFLLSDLTRGGLVVST
jgi:hypothetical protein